MQKIKSLLKMAFAGALLTGFATTVNAANYPDASKLDKTYSFSATVSYEPTIPQKVKNVLPASGHFTLKNGCTAIDEYTDWLGNEGTNVPVSYNQTTGIITLSTASLGYIADFGSTAGGYSLEMVKVEYSPVEWFVTEEGNIAIPDFDVKAGSNIVAHYTNCVIAGVLTDQSIFTRGGDDDGDDAGTDIFNWSVQTITDFSGTLGPQATFKVQITEVGSGSYEVTEVDGDTYLHGVPIKFTVTSGGVSIASSNLTIDGKAITFYTYTMAGGNAMPNTTPGWLNANNKYDAATGMLTLSGDSGFGYYDLSIGALVSGFKLLSSTAVTEEGGGGDETGEVAGDYEIYLQPVDMYGGTLNAVKVNVTISLQNEATSDPTTGSDVSPVYVIKENGTDYLLGQAIPFTWNESTGMATFENQFYVEEKDDMYIWFTPFLFNGTFTEGQGNLQFPFTPGVGFGTSQSLYGLGFFNSSSEDTFQAESVYKAYYLLNAPAEGNGKFDDGQGGDEPGEYPTQNEIKGSYNVNANVQIESGYEDAAAYLPTTFTFDLDSSISNFAGYNNGYIQYKYDPTTGVITIQSNRMQQYYPAGEYAPVQLGLVSIDGTWDKLINSGGDIMTWNVGEDGSITIPDFKLVNWSVSPAVLVATYSNIKVTPVTKGQLTFKNFSITVDPSTPDVAGTASVDINLAASPAAALSYKGYQFDVVVPDGIEVTGATYPENAQFRKVANLVNTYRVLVNLTEATNEQGKIATIGFSAMYDESQDYEDLTETITINNVIFSSPLGQDITTITGSDGEVTIIAKEIPVTKVEFQDVTLSAPSYSAENEVESITKGESLEISYIYEPEGATFDNDSFVWTCDDAEGLTFEVEDGVVIVNTDDVVIPEGEDSIEVTITGQYGSLKPSFEYTFTITKVVLGDSNDSEGEVTVADVVTTANYIAYEQAAGDDVNLGDYVYRFDYPNANVILTPNEEGEQEINTADVNATIAIAFDEEISESDRTSSAYNAKRHAGLYNTTDCIVAENYSVKAGKESVIGVSLASSRDYTSLQATAVIPEGMKVIGVTAGAAAAGHELVYNIGSSKVGIVLYSLNGTPLSCEGAIFNLVVAAQEDAANLTFDNVKASDRGFNTYILTSEGGRNVTGTTGIEGIDADEEGCRYFDLRGIEIPRPDKGIYIRVNANGEAVKVVK